MACRDAYKINTANVVKDDTKTTKAVTKTEKSYIDGKLFFGVESSIKSDDILQNNLTEFEWVTRNKLYPNFWGRNITGEDCLTKEEIDFLHKKGCQVAPIYSADNVKDTEEQGMIDAKKVAIRAIELGIRENTAIFLRITEDETITREYLYGFARGMIEARYTPGFMANTDAKYGFDRAYSGAAQLDKELLDLCVIWAVAPTLEEYNGTSDSHLIHPDRWVPFAPSGTTRENIAVWQYGKNCHPIKDDAENMTVFNVCLVKNTQIILEKMY